MALVRRLGLTNGRELSGARCTGVLGDPEEAADPVERRVRRFDQIAIAQDEHLLGRNVAVEVVELPPVRFPALGSAKTAPILRRPGTTPG